MLYLAEGQVGQNRNTYEKPSENIPFTFTGINYAKKNFNGNSYKLDRKIGLIRDLQQK